jgi:hypothetical protein
MTDGSTGVLREILDVLQDDPSSHKRWFHDEYFDLFVRQTTGGDLAAFELCYGIQADEKALVWGRGYGYFHDGDTSAGDFIGARLGSGDPLIADPIIERFERAAGGLPEALRLELEAHLFEFALQNAEGSARRTRFRRARWQSADQPKESRSGNP